MPPTCRRQGAGHLSAAQVSAITPQGLAHLAVPLRHVIASAFAAALPPIYAYLIPLLAAAFLLALILREIPLHTRADQDAANAADAADAPGAAQAAPPPARARPQGAGQGAAATIPGTPRQGAGSHHRPRPGRARATALGRRRASRLPVLTRRKIPPGG